MPEASHPALSPAGCVDLLWPSLAPCLVPSGLRDRLWAAADRLAPVPRLALEVRLGDDEAQVDLHQRITRCDGDPAALARWLETGDAALAGFLRDWAADREGLQELFTELFLEWDAPAGGGPARAPALFLACDIGRRVEGLRADRRGCLQRTLARFGRVLTDRAWSAACDGIEIGHIGLMLGRGETLRVNYKRVKPAQLGRLLAALEWPGQTEAACEHFDLLVEAADRVSVALDFEGASLRPAIGFEIFLDHPLEEGPRWPRVLDHLCDLGACAPRKREALLQVGRFVRALAPASSWPANWIVQAALNPASVSPSFSSGVSHLKLTLDGDGVATAKAYITAQHVWGQRVAQPPIGSLAPPRARPTLSAMQARAVGFLLEARQQNGLWSDFNRANGGCSTWVSAVAALALLQAGDAAGADCAREVATRLLPRQHASGGWPHNEAGPVDCDTTASVLRLLMATGQSDAPAAVAGLGFLERQATGRGVPTYAAESRILFQAGETDDAGWRAPHLCVTANCAALLPALLEVLRREQRSDGCWTPHWWRSPAYAAALAAEALTGGGDQATAVRAVAWAAARAGSPSGAFEAASLARLLALGGQRERAAARDLLAGLRHSQLADGSWESDAMMLVPAPQSPTASTDDRVAPDDRRVFTTANVLSAIAALRHAKGGAG